MASPDPNPSATGFAGYVSARVKRATSQLHLFPHALSLVWAAAHRWTIGWAALLIASGFLPVALVYLTRSLVNAVLAAMRPHGDIRPAAIDAVLMALVLLSMEGLRALEVWVRTAQGELVRNHISRLVQEKSAAADLAFYENAEFFDHLHRAKNEAVSVPLALVENLGSLAQNGVTLIAMAGVLTTFGFWLPVALIASALPALYVVLYYAVRQYRWSVLITPDERRSYYYDYVLSSREYAPELRLFGLAAYFRSRFDSLRSRLFDERMHLAQSQGMAEFAAGAASLLIIGLSLLWMAAKAVHGQATPGDIALFYQAFQQGSGLTRTLLNNVGQIYRNSLYLESLVEFLELKPVVTSPERPRPLPMPLAKGISFRNVTFNYPGMARPSLLDFSLEIPAGAIVAIVGENGAGKSTLIKLLCRFYDPEQGNVEMDGINLRDFDVNDLRGRISVLFQEPAHYNATVAENIALGEHHPGPELAEAAHAAGADTIVRKLPLGFENMLGRWFADGAELSVGEWQRIALARAFLRNTPILVLDEPTSAMDPWNEADWLSRFRKLAEGRTTLIVTHRFSTARIADRIAVMVDGRAIEQGTHEELLAFGGRYAEGWAAQNK
ncbi:MAG TPA: ABC transporter ATP-binding protein [Bryobacteraceae bacterium]|jgi:ATP-binding cassette subfamily B protein|nr:ABC transporter ATP-binding protein [Bryobacteraceae bacterium]